MPDLTKDQMIKCFTDGYKKKSEWLIGTEHEKFGFFKKSLEPISYNEILKIFNQLSKQFGWKKVYENSKVISLQKKNPQLLWNLEDKLNCLVHHLKVCLIPVKRLINITMS